MTDVRADFQQLALALFRKQKVQGEKAIAQLTEDELFVALDPEANSIAVIVRHLHGNMRSRWTNVLTSDGEKDDRRRDNEFLTPAERSRSQVMQWWNDGWRYVEDAISPLSPNELEASITIRGEPMTVMAAILRQLDHYAQHIGQIVLLAKHLRGESWQTLSIPRGKSDEYLKRRQ